MEKTVVEAGETRADETMADDAAYFGDCAAMYRFFSSILLRELTAEQIEILASSDMDCPDDGSEAVEGYRWLRTYLKRRGGNARQDLAVDYARVFLAAGTYVGDTAVPYESVYLSEAKILMQEPRDEVVAIYRSCGFAVTEDLQVPEDHAGFEMEFMALLCDRIAEKFGEGGFPAEELKIQKDFIEEHLLSWLPMLQERVDKYAELRFYPAMLRIAIGFLRQTRDADEKLLTSRS